MNTVFDKPTKELLFSEPNIFHWKSQ